MADEVTTTETPAASTGTRLKKSLMIWIPLFAIQLIVSYFIVALFVGPKLNPEAEKTRQEQAAKERAKTYIGVIYLVEDVIVNPKGSNGDKYLNVSVGLECADDKQVEFLKEREILVRDYLLSMLSSQTIEELQVAGTKEALRGKIFDYVNSLLSEKGLLNVYFHSFIIA